MSLENPKITVLMPVYNGEKYLRKAVDSILNQTFSDFEFLIINDGSSDDSVNIINSYSDPRIRLVHNEKNLKLVATLNKGFDLAQGEFLARMDCDDISLSQRLAKQVEVMDACPEVGVCGSWAKKINGNGEIIGNYRTPTGEKLAKFIWRPSPVIHPTALIRNKIFKQYRYDQEFMDAEDYELWLRVSRNSRLYNLSDYLLLYRMHSSSVSNTKRTVQVQSAYKAFTKYFGSEGISFEEFLSFMFESYDMNPAERARQYRKIGQKFGINGIDCLIDYLKYSLLWVRSKVS